MEAKKKEINGDKTEVKKKSTRFNKETGSEAGKKGGKISKRKSFDSRMKEFMDEVDDEGMSNEDKLRLVLMTSARDGNIQAVKEIFDRTFGKARQDIAIESESTIKIQLADKIEDEL